MNNNETTVSTPNQPESDRCNCPQCKGRAGTTRVCFNTRKLAARLQQNSTARRTALVLVSCFLLQGQSHACVKTHGAPRSAQAEVVKPTVDTDYYRSSDNPFFGD